MLFEDGVDRSGTTRRFRRPGSFAGSNASFQPRASIVGSNCSPRLTMKRDTSFGKKMNSTPLKRFFPFFKVMATYQQGNWLWFWTMRIHHAKLLRPFLEAQKNRLERGAALHTALS
ncbi:hypothetical protein P7H25_01920 [Paenibacillus larvae]|nr:hypothetical protein [Paenibacillus larvae]MDT2254658.1 hypothetical protein [Paenibacillus larvae]